MLYFMTLGFICGLLIPITASRFGKILPADPGTIFCSLLHRPHLPIAITDFHHRKLIQKWRKMFYFSLFWAVFLALCFGGAFALIGFEYILWFNLFFLLIACLVAVDQQYYLLPDFFTIPLLMLGFGFAAFTGLISPVESFCGALYAYLIAMLSVMLMRSINARAEFGAGDAKMMAGLGAWVGYMGINYILILSFLFFALSALIKRKDIGAFGPALGLASILILFAVYMK